MCLCEKVLDGFASLSQMNVTRELNICALTLCVTLNPASWESVHSELCRCPVSVDCRGHQPEVRVFSLESSLSDSQTDESTAVDNWLGSMLTSASSPDTLETCSVFWRTNYSSHRGNFFKNWGDKTSPTVASFLGLEKLAYTLTNIQEVLIFVRRCELWCPQPIPRSLPLEHMYFLIAWTPALAQFHFSVQIEHSEAFRASRCSCF